MNPVSKGQIGVFYKGAIAPLNKDLIWLKVDGVGKRLGFFEWNDESSAWERIASLQVINHLNSTLTLAAALSPNMGRVLDNKVAVNSAKLSSLEQNIYTDLLEYVSFSMANKPNGFLQLDLFNRIPPIYLPQGGRVPRGTWDASLGTPPTGAPENGWEFYINVPGNTLLGDYDQWEIGDTAIYVDDQWDRIPGLNTELYDGLDSDSITIGATANQVRLLKGLIDTIDGSLTDLTARADALENGFEQMGDTINALLDVTSGLQQALNNLDSKIPEVGASKVTRELIQLDAGTYVDNRMTGLSLDELRMKFRIEMPGRIGNLLMTSNVSFENDILDFKSSSMSGSAYLEILTEE
jgi:hypothetical protein